jgi:predicted dehydrogenase
MEDNQEKKGNKLSRRDILKSLATVPIVGAMAYGIYRKERSEQLLSNMITRELGISNSTRPAEKVAEGKELRIGIIGYGIRGKMLVRALGFAHPTVIDDWIKGGKESKEYARYENFQNQENLNIRITAVCDIFDTYAKMALEAGANTNKAGSGGKMGEQPKRYLDYKELIASPDVDAIVISTPDHWHGPMTIEAAKAGKHVYCEKPFSWSVEETYEIREIVKKSNIVFQLGHQGRQIDSYLKAQEVIEKGLLGPISLIELTTNRNDPNGAWVYPIHKDANPQTIDWEQFIGQAPWHDFSLERFFRWRCWWDYSTGLSGDLLTHEYDSINQIMHLGIPESATSTGGIYFYKDGRDVPDVLTTVFEYPKRDLSILYSATLSNQLSRGKKFLGHDGYMEVGDSLTVYPDARSTKYADQLKSGLMDPARPIYTNVPGRSDIDATTSATERYFAGRGLMFTYRGDKRYDTTHLHLKEWIDCIRTGNTPSCDIDQSFQEAITAHMGTLSYKHQKKVFWDEKNEKIIV